MTDPPHSVGANDERRGIEAGSSRPAWVGSRPVSLTTLVGREQETQSLRALLVRRGLRLVTLTGPGGVGKTRLAIAVASGIDSGFETVAFVPLASVRDPDLVMATIARAVGLQSTDEPTPVGLGRFLQSRTMLLILDNLRASAQRPVRACRTSQCRPRSHHARDE